MLCCVKKSYVSYGVVLLVEDHLIWLSVKMVLLQD